jgi:hypothetical protein
MVNGATELLDSVLQYYHWSLKNLFFNKKKLIHYGDRDGAGIPEPIWDGDEIQFLIPVWHG